MYSTDPQPYVVTSSLFHKLVEVSYENKLQVTQIRSWKPNHFSTIYQSSFPANTEIQDMDRRTKHWYVDEINFKIIKHDTAKIQHIT